MVIVVRERWRRRRTNARRAEAVEVGVVAIVVVAGREDLLVRLGGGHSTDGEGMNWMTRGGGDDETGGDRKEVSMENDACEHSNMWKMADQRT